MCALIAEGNEEDFNLLKQSETAAARRTRSTRNDAAKTKRKGAIMSKGNHKRAHLLARQDIFVFVVNTFYLAMFEFA